MRRKFKVGDRLFYPNHGIGLVENIRELEGREFYELCLTNGTHARALVPVIDNSAEFNLRKLSSKKALLAAMDIMRQEEPEKVPFKERYESIRNCMKLGRPEDIAQALRMLVNVADHRPMTWAELQLYRKVKNLLVGEMKEVLGITSEAAEQKIYQRLLVGRNGKHLRGQLLQPEIGGFTKE